MTEDDLVTIAEAAKALGIDQRQVRRYAGQVRTEDRTPTDIRPVRVRLSSVRVLIKRIPPSHRVHIDRSSGKDKVSASTQLSGQVSADPRDIELITIKIELAAAQREAALLRHTMEVLEQSNRDLRRMLPPAPDPVATPGEVVSAPPTAAVPIETSTDTQPTRRPWWAWRRRGKA